MIFLVTDSILRVKMLVVSQPCSLLKSKFTSFFLICHLTDHMNLRRVKFNFFTGGFLPKVQVFPVFLATVPLSPWLLPKIRQIAAWVKQSHLPLPLCQLFRSQPLQTKILLRKNPHLPRNYCHQSAQWNF